MRAPGDIARVAIEAIRAQGRRVLLARGGADLAAELLFSATTA